MHDNLNEIHVEKNVLITLHDGVHLAADLYMPQGQNRSPVLISYYPYHKDDIIGASLDYSCRYFAVNGYAHLIVDFRGLGNSEGKAWEMNDPRENIDGACIVEWAAHQPWCDGNVGMWGISYGGITSLQTASERPPHLKAIVPIFTPYNIYHDLIFPGGCLNCLGAFGDWGSRMVAMNIMPPGYQDQQGRWYRIWKERLENIEHQMFPWQGHIAFDEYWQAKVIPIEKINIPTFVIGGWRDLFPQAMIRIYEKLSVPKKLFMGPWMHNPMDVAPQDPWDYHLELKRWWDYWLKNEKNSIMKEPPVTIYVQGVKQWRHELEWPIARTKLQNLFLSHAGILKDRPEQKAGCDIYTTDPTVGITAGLWDPVSRGIGMPLDQGRDDLRSLIYTTKLLSEDIEITGSPETNLFIAMEDAEEVNLVVKLNDVGPKGDSTLITTGWLKGSHYQSHEQPEPLRKGQIYKFHIPLWPTSYLVPKGHRLRLSVSCSDFPRIWPTLINPKIHLFFGKNQSSFLCIPVISPRENSIPKPNIYRPDTSINRAPSFINVAPQWCIEEDPVNSMMKVFSSVEYQMILPWGMEIKNWRTRSTATVSALRPDWARVEGETNMLLHLPSAGEVEIHTLSWISHDRMSVTGEIKINRQLFFEKKWER
ncbi:MAG: CocE/NonD family hydrolase [Spirochaetota bacterium]|nr:MAG: CocE/NonD family hydrolase [Spirochaetota bacterium]